MTHDSSGTTQWLLEGDPAVVWQAQRDLLDQTESTWGVPGPRRAGRWGRSRRRWWRSSVGTDGSAQFFSQGAEDQPLAVHICLA